MRERGFKQVLGGGLNCQGNAVSGVPRRQEEAADIVSYNVCVFQFSGESVISLK